MTLKTNLHLHTAEDPVDNLSYTIYQAIDQAQKLGFDVLALTCHRKFVWKKDYADYAQQKNILLIPGIEANIEKKHVVILNPPIGEAGSDKEAENIKTFKNLKEYKQNNPQIFIIAPHPFVWSLKSLGKKLIRQLAENPDLFDAIELSIYSNKIFNFNKKAKKIAEKYNKPLIANSDCHFLKNMDRGYCLVNTKAKTVEAIFETIKKHKIENYVQPMGLWTMLIHRAKGIINKLF